MNVSALESFFSNQDETDKDSAQSKSPEKLSILDLGKNFDQKLLNSFLEARFESVDVRILLILFF